MSRRLASLPDLGKIHDHREDPDAYITSIISCPALRKPEKDRFGEVFTPPAIINAMLDKLPPHLWSDPAKKWLDPAAGFGNFPMVVYARLMAGLVAHIPDPTERSRHIIERMLYMVEYNPESCARIREIFGTTANLSCGSFLDSATFTRFDVIIGNPPFNAEQAHEGKKGGGANLWPKFVEKSLDTMMSRDAYLLFVHPALWRKPQTERSTVSTLFNKMTHENHMIYLEIHSKADGKRDFGVQTRYDFYLIQKRPPIPHRDFTTTVKDQHGQEHQIDLSLWQFFLPNHSFELIQPLLSSNPREDYVIFSRSQFGSDQKWVSQLKDDGYEHPLVHSTPTNGPRIYWSSTRDQPPPCIPMFGVPKVIFGESGINNVIIDKDGEYGMTQGAIGLKLPDDGGLFMKSILESDTFNRILDAMSFSNFRIDWRMFLYFRPDFYKVDEVFRGSKKYQRPRLKTEKKY
jgi:hypothetical protein